MMRQAVSTPAAELPEMPPTHALVRATVLILLLAILVFVGAVLPAERGIDPTGLGRITGLKEMGEFKVQADKEFAQRPVNDALRK